MRVGSIKFLFVIALAFPLCTAAQWQNIGSAGFSAGQASEISLAFDNNNTPYIAFKDANSSNKLTVMKYNGSSWVTVGSAGITSTAVTRVSLEIDGNNIPYVAYIDGTTKVSAVKYDGSSWVQVGSAGFTGINCDYVEIKTNSSNIPYVIFRDYATGYKATVMKYDGSSWVAEGSAGFSASSVAYTRLEFDSNDLPVAGFLDQSPIKATVMKYNGSSWVNVGSAGFSAGASNFLDMALDNNNQPYVSYTDAANSGKASVMMYNGSSWVNVGSAGFSAGGTVYTNIEFDQNNTCYIAYQDGGTSSKVVVQKYNGSSWVNVGTGGASPSTGSFVSMELTSQGIPYIAFRDGANSQKASVMSYGYVWTGTSSTAWNTASNWLIGSVPSSTSDVTIPTGCTNYPNITSTATPACKDLVIQSSASLTVGSSGTLSIYGTISNSGTFTATSGKIKMAGSSAQTIPASTFSSNTIQDLEISNSAGVSLGGTLGITGTLTPTSGTFTTGGFLTLKSTVSGTGRIGAGTGSYLSGTVTLERYIPGGKRAFRFIGNPTTGTLTLNNLQDDIYITGSGGSTNGFDSTQLQNPSAFWFNNTATAPGTWAAFTHTSTDNNWTSTRGIRVLVRGDRTQTGTLTGANPTPNAVTLDITGTLKTGNQNISLTNTGSYHLLANPYASPVDIGTVIGAASNIGTQYWVWDPQSGTRGAYVTKLKSGGAYSIPSMSAFMVLPTGSSTLAFTESNKTSAESNGNTFFRSNGITDVGEIKLLYNGYPSDNIFIRKDNNALTGFDAEDGKKLWNPDMSFYLVNESNDTLGIDTRPLSGTVTIPLGIITNTTAATYAISLDNWNINGYDVFIKDKLLNIEHSLTPGNNYSFTTTVGNIGASRFDIILRPSGVLPLSNVQLSAQQKGNDVLLQWNINGQENAVDYAIEYSKEGRSFEKIASQHANGSKQYNWLHTSVNGNTHYYRIKSVAADGKITYSSIAKISTGKTAASFSVYPNPAKQGDNIMLALNGLEKGIYTLRITDAMGRIVQQQTLNAGYHQTVVISPNILCTAGYYTINIRSTLFNHSLPLVIME